MQVLALVLLLPAVLAAVPPIVRITDSPITLPIAKRIRAVGVTNFVEADRARARSLIQMSKAKATKAGDDILNTNADSAVGNDPATNTLVSYVASVGVGNPPTTGSSNTWVGADTAYVKTPTSIQTGDTVSVTYGSGSFSGTEFLDLVTLSNGFAISNQSIGVATSSSGFTGVDGILGLGPTDLTLGTLSPDTTTSVSTVTDNLSNQRIISTPLLAVSFEPTNSQAITNGELTFGGIDSSKFIGNITYVPITSSSPSNTFWGIEQNITYGGIPIMFTTAGIVDTGTTLLLLPPLSFAAYVLNTGATPDSTTGFLKMTTSEFANLKSLFFSIGETTFEFTANAQAWPRNLNSFIGGDPNSVYLVVANIGLPNRLNGIGFINGQVFLERFYSVFDTANKRVGLANTNFTFATTN
ncbi:hypothetical protein M422DRAFT_257106 [Sphaerobolus stellatus SS14]|uniref:Unplaced genomic scaffold SPHSTscaffold_72, whole genome shotgun sequence n=1 Tax=Sphaerobolus stellatus (strain SS14) TaxID=990650 RepID=A0A0C9UA82_SPHS4|nr:hypothetical protein M422DRAFT_257106 [Sphaerobolus stellatus SS14]